MRRFHDNWNVRLGYREMSDTHFHGNSNVGPFRDGAYYDTRFHGNPNVRRFHGDVYCDIRFHGNLNVRLFRDGAYYDTRFHGNWNVRRFHGDGRVYRADARSGVRFHGNHVRHGARDKSCHHSGVPRAEGSNIVPLVGYRIPDVRLG